MFPSPHAIAALLFLPMKILYRENPVEVLVLEKIRESAVQLTILLNIAVLLFLPVKILYRENPPVEVPVWKQSVKVEYSSSYYYMFSLPFCPTHRSFADRSGK